jgi:hypothetical protein
VRDFEIIFNPYHKMIFERPFDDLVEKVRGEKFVYICTWEVGCERLMSTVRAQSKTHNNTSLAWKPGTMP